MLDVLYGAAAFLLICVGLLVLYVVYDNWRY